MFANGKGRHLRRRKWNQAASLWAARRRPFPPLPAKEVLRHRFGEQWRAKQKVCWLNGGLAAKQLKRLRHIARGTSNGSQMPYFFGCLERRLPLLLVRLHWVKSARMARQWIRHGWVLRNGKPFSWKNARMRNGDQLSLHPLVRKSALQHVLVRLRQRALPYAVPAYLMVDWRRFTAQFLRAPFPQEIPVTLRYVKTNVFSFYRRRSTPLMIKRISAFLWYKCNLFSRSWIIRNPNAFG